MTITPASVDGFPKTGRPWNNITPFTYRDGLTYLEVLEALRAYVRDYLVQHINDEMNGLVGDWNDQVTIIENAVSDALAQHSQEMHELADRWMQEQIENNDEITANILKLSSSLTKTALEPVLVEYVAQAGSVQDAVDSRAVVSVEQAVIENTSLRGAVDNRARVSVEQAVVGNTTLREAVDSRARTSVAQAVIGNTPVADAVSDRAVSAVNSAITETGELSDTLKQETLNTAAEGATSVTAFRDAIDQRVTVGTADAISTALADSQTLEDAAAAAMLDAAVKNRLSWNKPRLTSGSLDELFGAENQGVYAVATAVTGGPRAGGLVEVTHDAGSGLSVQVWRHSLSTVTSVYRRSGNASGWSEWVSEKWQGGDVPRDFDFDTELSDGFRGVVTTSAVNGPAGFGIGILEVFQFGSGAVQRYTEANTGRVAHRRTISGAFNEWLIYPTVSSIEAQIQAALPDEGSATARGFRTVPLAVTLPGTTQTQTQTQEAVRWSRQWAHKPTRVRLHVSNRNPANNVHGDSVNIVGAQLGVGTEAGALTQAVDALDSGLMPGDGGELVGPWIAVPGTDGDWLTVSVGYTSGTDQQLLQGGGWTNPTASVYNGADTAGWTYSQATPFYVWLEAEVPSRVPVLLVHGDSSVVGTASETPVQDSFAMQYALGEGALPVFYAQHGSTMANWQTDSARWSAFYPGLTPAADAVLTGIGGNDLGGGADLSAMQSRWQGIRAAHEQRWPGVPVYVCNRYASTRPPAVEAIRREFNSWLESRPVDERWVFDFSSTLSDAEDEALKPEYSADGLHPNRAGHLAVSALLTATPPTPFTLTAAQARAVV